jgi:hypothetical protein
MNSWQVEFESGEIVYRDEQGLVLCGDCLEILPQLPKATMIFAFLKHLGAVFGWCFYPASHIEWRYLLRQKALFER